VQSSYRGLLIVFTSPAASIVLLSAAPTAAVDVMEGRPREVFWLVLAVLWTVMARCAINERRVSGAVLLDIARRPCRGYRVDAR
jgi:hypothetical protein